MSIADRCGSPHKHTLAEKRAIGKRQKVLYWMTPEELLADVFFVDAHGELPIHEAARRGDASLIEKMLPLLGVDPYYTASHTKRTPLMYACHSRCSSVRRVNAYCETVNLLIECGSGCHEEDWIGQRVIHFAASGGPSLSRASIMLSHGVDRNVQEHQGYTPLGYAAFFGNLDIARLLLENDADPTIANRWGQTPAMIAEERGHFDIADVLQEAAE